MKEEQNRFLVAVILSGLILFSWQYFFAPKQPISNEESVKKITQEVESKEVSKTQNVVNDQVNLNQELTEQVITLQNKDNSVEINNLLQIVRSKHLELSAKENYKTDKLAEIKFIINGKDQSVSFYLDKVSDHLVRAESKIAKIEIKLDELGKLNFKIKNNSQNIKAYVYGTEISESYTQYSSFSYLSDSLEKETIADVDQPKIINEKSQWFGVDYNYHLLGFSYKKENSSKLTITSNSFSSELMAGTQEINYFFIKKKYDSLLNMGDNLHMSVDFGWFSFLAIPILRGLQFIYRQVPNYGWAIIILTLFIRLLTSPLQFISSRSMKKMQKIQPQLNKIREKYKDNPQKMQQETMTLFKKSGANPMSGCLPMILQMPIFFAFYKVLYEAVELMGAPFMGWITDLSIKDPFYVLPIAVSLGMVLQQKVMPAATTDPTQKKVMMFLPLIFGFIMKDLPSGLNLYIFVSTIFGITQQFVLMKTIKV